MLDRTQETYNRHDMKDESNGSSGCVYGQDMQSGSRSWNMQTFFSPILAVVMNSRQERNRKCPKVNTFISLQCRDIAQSPNMYRVGFIKSGSVHPLFEQETQSEDAGAQFCGDSTCLLALSSSRQLDRSPAHTHVPEHRTWAVHECFPSSQTIRNPRYKF